MLDINKQDNNAKFKAEYQKLIAADIAEAQAHLDELPESQRRGLTLDTLRHFGCGYLPHWTLTKCRAKKNCGTYVKADGTPKKLPPSSERIIIPTPSMNHFNAVATPRARRTMNKDYWKQHAGDMELFCDPDALKADTIVLVEGEIDAMSIWQATQGKIPVVAILGCNNSSATLGKRLRGDLKGKRFVILLDADAPGKKAAEKFCKDLRRERVPAVTRYLYDYLPLVDRKPPQAIHVDANELLQYHGAERLMRTLNSALETATADLDKVAAKIDAEIAAAGTEDAAANLKVVTTARATREPKAQVHVINQGDNISNDDARRIIADITKNYVHARNLDRGDWFKTGCVMKRYGFDLDDFDKWSNDGDPRYSAESCANQWQDMWTAEQAGDRGHKLGTLIDIAKKFGYNPPPMGRHNTEDIIADIQNRCEWKRDNRGNLISIRPTQANLDLIFEEDPNLRGLVGYNQFQDTYSFLKKAPWHSDNNFAGGQWRDADTAELRGYIRRNYAELKDKEGIEDTVVHFANQNAFHPVKQYFHNLPRWDGKKRAENLFIKFLDADDTPQTREVTLNWLLAAVARIFRPGCRYQTALVLHGNQGIGKSYILERIGGQWYSAMVDNVSDPHALDALPNIWIGEFKEMAAMRKEDVNQIKSFLERGADNRRKPYERHATNTPRHCVFGITVNDEGFLRDQTGNRRFLVIHCNRPKFSYVEGLTDEYIAQLWAEVYQIFNAELKDLNETELGKRLELRPETKIAMEAIAEKYVQDDEMTAEIKAHLEKSIPEQIIWKLLPKDARKKFFAEGKITIEEGDLDAMFKTKSGKITPEKQEAFDKAKEVCASVRRVLKTTSDGQMPLFLTFYGREQRNHICAAEIYHECFANGDKRKQMYRIQEILSKLDGWQLGDRNELRRVDPEYPEQRKPYFRVQVADKPLDPTIATAAEFIDEDDLPI